MNVKWASVAIIPALMTLTMSVAGVPRAAVAAAPPECQLEWSVLGGCPTSDSAVAAYTVPASPVLATVAAAPPECTLEWGVLGGCPTSDHAVA